MNSTKQKIVKKFREEVSEKREKKQVDDTERTDIRVSKKEKPPFEIE